MRAASGVRSRPVLAAPSARIALPSYEFDRRERTPELLAHTNAPHAASCMARRLQTCEGMSATSPRVSMSVSRGFTLLELMWALVIVGIIMILAMPGYGHFRNSMSL